MQKTEFKKKRRKGCPTTPPRTFTAFINEGFMFYRNRNLGKALLCFNKVGKLIILTCRNNDKVFWEMK